ncbi:hypothetical protein ACFE04_018131 [Oxalis oulophora]
MANNNNIINNNKLKEDASSAPQSDRWYNLTLGNSFNDSSSNKYCTLRYEFKPASIDKSKPGSMYKNKENRVSVEFQNNQLGKPTVNFEGSSEDYKDNDAVLFFDGHSFRLERLHRAVKQLRHVRKGESGFAPPPPVPVVVAEPRSSSPLARDAKTMHGKSSFVPPAMVEVEMIDIGEPAKPGPKPMSKGFVDPFDQSHMFPSSPAPKTDEADEHQDIDIEDILGAGTPEEENHPEQKVDNGLDMNEPHHNESDDEIADVDDNGMVTHLDLGPTILIRLWTRSWPLSERFIKFRGLMVKM